MLVLQQVRHTSLRRTVGRLTHHALRMQGTGYLTCGNCVGVGCVEGGDCPSCQGLGKVMCTSCLCTGKKLATEHDPRIDPFV